MIWRHAHGVAAVAFGDPDEVDAGQIEAWHMRTCITWLNERIAP